MAKKVREVAAGELSARCLELLDEVAQTGGEIVVTRNGEAVARLTPIRDPASLMGSVVYEDDIVSPLDAPWAANDK